MPFESLNPKNWAVNEVVLSKNSRASNPPVMFVPSERAELAHIPPIWEFSPTL